MFTIISRIFHYGVKNFYRNGWLSTATVVIMVLALSVSIGLMTFRFTTQKIAGSIQDKIDISVYFKTTTPEDEILNIKKSLESLSEVKDITYISRDEALEIFKSKNKDDETINQALIALNENPLEASLSIKAHRPEQYASIAQYLSSPNLSGAIDEVSYKKNQMIIDRLTSIVNNVSRGGLLLTIVMALVAGLVVFNTIRLAIYSNREEIGIMRVVGASNALVRGPYIIEGIISGLMGAVASVILAAPVLHFVSPMLKGLDPELNIVQYFYSNLLIIFGYQVLFGVTIGVLSSFVAIRRYLKN